MTSRALRAQSIVGLDPARVRARNERKVASGFGPQQHGDTRAYQDTIQPNRRRLEVVADPFER